MPAAPSDVSPVERRVMGFIEEARSQGLEGEALVTQVVERELDSQFGPAATPAMREAVTKFFREDPYLMTLFNRLAS